MNVKGLIIASNDNYTKMFNCEVSVPALKVHLNEKESESLSKVMPNTKYTNVMFLIQGNSVEVSLYEKEKGVFYANAKEIAKLDLDNMTILKENTLIKKYLKNPIPQKKLKKF